MFIHVTISPVDLFIYSPVEGHLNCSWNFKMTVQEVVSIVCTSSGGPTLSFSLGVSLRVEFPGQRVAYVSLLIDIASFPK